MSGNVIDEIQDKQINFIALLGLLLIHAALSIHFSNTETSSSQAQAPVYDIRISVNLLPPVKQNNRRSLKLNR